MDMFLDAIDNLPDDVMQAKYEGNMPKKTKRFKSIHEKTPFDKTIDLHGLTKIEAIGILRNILTHAKGKRLKILVITGKGIHSQDSYGIIREAVSNFLKKASPVYVSEYKYADQKYGGDGAFEIITK